MSDFYYEFETSKDDPEMVTKMHVIVEPWMGANRVQALVADLERFSNDEGRTTVIEAMRRLVSRQLYIRIGFRNGDLDEWENHDII